MSEDTLAPYKPRLILVDEDGTVLSGPERDEIRKEKKREQKTKSYANQIAKLKRDGLYGSSRDPMWNPRTRMHDCCGAPRAYYHRKGCKVAGKRLY